MAQLQAEVKRGFLRVLARKAGEAALADVLAAFQDQAYEVVKTGQIQISASGNGYSGSFDVGGIGRQLTPDQIFALGEEFLTVYDEAAATLSTAGNASPTDAQILSTMLASDRLQRITSARDDYTLLRVGGRF